MFNNWKIGKRLTLAFALTLTLVGVVAVAGFWGLSRMVDTANTILQRDAKMLEYASDLEVHTLNLRRYEKDIFLNIGDKDKVGEYTSKWQTAFRDATEDINNLEKLAGTEDGEIVRTMRTDLATYSSGFENLLRGINDGMITTAVAANDSTGRYKDD